jgi:hypothetical protein
MKEMSTQIRTTVAVLATAATFLTGCHKRPETVAPEQGENLTTLTLPAAPVVAADKELAALFRDAGLPGEVRASLMDPAVHAILRGIWESGKTEQPFSYVRNAYPPDEGGKTVIVLQHLLNVALEPIIERGREHHKSLLSAADSQSSPWREDTLASARWLKAYLDTPTQPLALDGDFGRRSHTRRAMLTQIANVTSHFPHVKEDGGANDTAIGPRTLRLFTETKPEFRRYFEADFEMVQLSYEEALRSVVEIRSPR